MCPHFLVLLRVLYHVFTEFISFMCLLLASRILSTSYYCYSWDSSISRMSRYDLGYLGSIFNMGKDFEISF